jgi:hypothetical protein
LEDGGDGKAGASVRVLYDGAMHGKRTPAWHWSRLLLAVGIILVLLVAVGAWLAAQPMIGRENVELGPILMPTGRFVAIATLALAIIGLAWMIRILRGPRDEPFPWRYRDR